MIETIYHGSVKNVLGPVLVNKAEAVIFEYTDAFSVFDWGRMPDLLSGKGEALAVMAADLFERIERPETWREFSKSPVALEMRKANRFGAVFNELGEKLQAEGLRTHYLGVIEGDESLGSSTARAVRMGELKKPIRRVLARRVNATKPRLSMVLGRSVPDYIPTRAASLPRLIPVEVVFRFSCPPGSSLIDRVDHDSSYLASRGFPEAVVEPGCKWGFPILEMFTKLESTDRPVTLVEALAISGISGEQINEMLLKTAWVAGLLKSLCNSVGLELADGKLEWGVSESGEVFLVDAIGPDELRIIRNGVQLSKEFLRSFYRDSAWYALIGRAKKQAATQGVADWKKLVTSAPPALPQLQKDLAANLYFSLANAISGRTWFPDAWSLDRVASAIQNLREGDIGK